MKRLILFFLRWPLLLRLINRFVLFYPKIVQNLFTASNVILPVNNLRHPKQSSTLLIETPHIPQILEEIKHYRAAGGQSRLGLTLSPTQLNLPGLSGGQIDFIVVNTLCSPSQTSTNYSSFSIGYYLYLIELICSFSRYIDVPFYIQLPPFKNQFQFRYILRSILEYCPLYINGIVLSGLINPNFLSEEVKENIISNIKIAQSIIKFYQLEEKCIIINRGILPTSKSELSSYVIVDSQLLSKGSYYGRKKE